MFSKSSLDKIKFTWKNGHKRMLWSQSSANFQNLDTFCDIGFRCDIVPGNLEFKYESLYYMIFEFWLLYSHTDISRSDPLFLLWRRSYNESLLMIHIKIQNFLVRCHIDHVIWFFLPPRLTTRKQGSPDTCEGLWARSGRYERNKIF